MQDFFSGGGLALIDIFPQLAVGEGESPGPLALVLLQDVPVLQLLQQGEDLVLVPVGEGQNGLQRHSVIEKESRFTSSSSPAER